MHSRVNGDVWQEQVAAAAASGPSGPHSRTIKAFLSTSPSGHDGSCVRAPPVAPLCVCLHLYMWFSPRRGSFYFGCLNLHDALLELQRVQTTINMRTQPLTTGE